MGWEIKHATKNYQDYYFFYRINSVTSWNFSSTTLMNVEHNRGLLCSTVILTL